MIKKLVNILTNQKATNRFLLTLIFVINWFGVAVAQISSPPSYPPLPNTNQLNWQQMEYYAFVHFSINTFTDQEWGSGSDSAQLFNPDKLDCRQWARVCKEAGMKGIIITAKHHSGFCLWPSKYTDYSVKKSPWKNGNGDIVRELADACKEYGLKLGIYLSPWDRNYKDYGKPEYIAYFRNQLEELLTNYGDIFEVWFDGANGGSGFYGGANETRKIDRKTYYDWPNTYKLIRQLQPKIVIWNDGGDRGDLRWVGTESGYVGEKNWSLLNAKGDVPEDMLQHGLENGDSWVPGEVNTSTRPGWFYHHYEDNQVKTMPELLNIYYSSIGRNGTLLLNFPIDRHGLIHENDEKAVVSLAKTIKKTFAKNLAQGKKTAASNVLQNSELYNSDKAVDNDNKSFWATDDGVKSASLNIDFEKQTTFNRFLVQEPIQLGQRVKSFKIEAQVNGEWKELVKQSTIGYKRILKFPTITATSLRLTIIDSKSSPLIANIGVFNAPQILNAPSIVRDKSGFITITAADPESEIFYTVNGSKPTQSSKKYIKEIASDGRIDIRAVAFDPISKKYSPENQEKFDIPKKDWRVLNTDDKKAEMIIDGNRHTSWIRTNTENKPVELIIDLGNAYILSGFKYLPAQNLDKGLINKYEILISKNNKDWVSVKKDEFSNIKNNPLWQVIRFNKVSGRFIKLVALDSLPDKSSVAYAEIDVITE